jgi:hypothetical protein
MHNYYGSNNPESGPSEPEPEGVEPVFRPDENATAQKEPSGLGCWLLPQDYIDRSGADRQNRYTRLPTGAPTQIASFPASIGNATAADYNQETFRTPFDVSQPVVCTGSLINTYTGEVADTYEDAIPPPDREGDDFEAMVKSSQLKFQWANGGEQWKLNKTELQQPLPAGDSGPALPNATYRTMQSVKLEAAERFTRDTYFSRNDLIPTEFQMTRNPFGYSGFQNMLRVNPWIPNTQELDTKDWTSNATQLPSTARALQSTVRLHEDAPAGRLGLMQGLDVADAVLPHNVRKSDTSREQKSDCARNADNRIYGAQVPGSQQLREDTTRSDRPGMTTGHQGARAATAESVLRTLRKQVDVERLPITTNMTGAHANVGEVKLTRERVQSDVVQLMSNLTGSRVDVSESTTRREPALGSSVTRIQSGLTGATVPGTESRDGPEDHRPNLYGSALQSRIESATPFGTQEFQSKLSFDAEGRLMLTGPDAAAFSGQEVRTRLESRNEDSHFMITNGPSAMMTGTQEVNLKDDSNPSRFAGGIGGGPEAHTKPHSEYFANENRGLAPVYRPEGHRVSRDTQYYRVRENGMDDMVNKHKDAGRASIIRPDVQWDGRTLPSNPDHVRRHHTPKPQRPSVPTLERCGALSFSEGIRSRSEEVA